MPAARLYVTGAGVKVPHDGSPRRSSGGRARGRSEVPTAAARIGGGGSSLMRRNDDEGKGGTSPLYMIQRGQPAYGHGTAGRGSGLRSRKGLVNPRPRARTNPGNTPASTFAGPDNRAAQTSLIPKLPTTMRGDQPSRGGRSAAHQGTCAGTAPLEKDAEDRSAAEKRIRGA